MRARRRLRSPLGRRVALLALVLLALAPSVVDARPWSWLGVRIRDLSEQEMDEIASRHGIREGFGVMIVEVLADTPAARAGLKSGDIVVAFGERPVVETRVLQRLIASAPVDQESNLTVLRAEGRRSLRIRLTSMPPTVAGDRVAAEFGFALQEALLPAEPVGTRPSPQPPTTSAPTVGVVARGGSAEKAGVEVGDVILQIGDQTVITREAAREALARGALDRPLALTVRRGDHRLSMTLAAPVASR